MKDLARSYCFKIQFGVESGNDFVRNEIMKRSMERSTIVEAFKLARKYNIKTNAINIIGVPGETKEMLLDTVKLNREINPTTSNVNIFYPYKGTPLGDMAFEKGLVNIEKYKNFSNERRESVMNYPQDWLDTLKYFRENWTKEVYPFYNLKHYPELFSKTKTIVGSIPVVGNFLRKQYYRQKHLDAKTDNVSSAYYR